jgi:acyl-CoA oxidase
MFYMAVDNLASDEQRA